MRLRTTLFFLSMLPVPALIAADAAALRSARSDNASWLMYGRDYAAWRYSELAQINRSNIANLAPLWVYQTGVGGKQEAAPLVFDGLMFFTAPSNHSFAVDLATGRPVWHKSTPIPPHATGCCGQPNRGFATLNGKLYKVTFQGTLQALDAKTGNLIWETEIADPKKGYSATVAPLAVKNMILTGVTGAEFGVRGYIDAYDATTGKLRWRFYTTGGPEDPTAQRTWGGDSWKRGGGSIWVTGTYDPDTNLTYWGTGNPGPDMFGDERPGDNLYTCSVVALDVDTGKLRWHYQFTPHDVHDWDAMGDPVLVDLTHKGKRVRAILNANRNGHHYLLDRVTGEFLNAKAYTKVSWADGIDSKGRPILVPGQDPSEQGTKACPGLGGGHNWEPTSYSPQTGLHYFSSTDGCHIYYKTRQDFVEGAWYQGSIVDRVPKEPAAGSIVAMDPAKGEIAWRLPLIASPSGGMLSTAGGLLFAGDQNGYFFAMDAATGKVLWKFQTGGTVGAAAITYSFQGQQRISVLAGGSLYTFALSVSEPSRKFLFPAK
ncbi:MAG: PQQ-dependent dehydrogenase, methanol/ethanol family [Acidobacteria bacterium]|nr:PQQ-dependent dehydrogenase, methanol/ethanol family [Acidobacteriota bacterium]